MKQNQKLLIAIGLGLLILMNVFILGWVITDFFSGPNGPEETVAATVDREKTTGAEPTEEVTTEESTDEPTTEMPATEEPTTEEIPTEPPLPETEQVFAEVRRPIYNRYVGSAVYEIGYSESKTTPGPTDFIVEDNIIVILDAVNNRIVSYNIENAEGKHLGVINAYRLRNLYFVKSGQYALIRGNSDVEVYYEANSKVMDWIDLRLKRPGIYVEKIVSVDDTGVVVEDNSPIAIQFRYDWPTDSFKVLGVAPKTPEVKVNGQNATVLGKIGDRVYYQYREGEKNIIGVEVENVGRWYVTQELNGYHSVPSDNLYVSQDGKLYLMECFDDQTVISELMLGEPVEEPTEGSTEEATEDDTKEVTPYDEVLDEYFAKREAIYTSTEMAEIDPGRWQYFQEWKEQSQVTTVLNAEISYGELEILSETESEIKVRVYASVELTYLMEGFYQPFIQRKELAHIIRLSKQDGKYQIQTDSCWDMFTEYQSGLAEDIELLKQR